MDFAREFGLAAQVVEKDYVLGWLLAGILKITLQQAAGNLPRKEF
jgi:hypothetical protein